jgi:hypothetical protein
MTTPSNLLYVILAIFSGQTLQKCYVQVHKQDWCIDGKHRIYWPGLETGEQQAYH